MTDKVRSQQTGGKVSHKLKHKRKRANEKHKHVFKCSQIERTSAASPVVALMAGQPSSGVIDDGDDVTEDRIPLHFDGTERTTLFW